MKRHSGWLAAGLLLFAVLACNLSKNSNNTNNSNNSNSNSNKNSNSNASVITRPANAEVYVDSLTMNKDDNGRPGEPTTTFAASDRTVHLVINLNKAKGGTKVRVVWVAVDVVGAKDRELESSDYTTKSFENKINGHLTWSKDWPIGTYKADVYINGALDKRITYTIE